MMRMHSVTPQYWLLTSKVVPQYAVRENNDQLYNCKSCTLSEDTSSAPVVTTLDTSWFM